MRSPRGLPALIIGTLLLGALAVPASAAGANRWVDDDGAAGPGGCRGTATAPKRIQKAIDRADAGDTVIVCPGAYAEALTIGAAKDGITLRAASQWKARVVQPDDLSGAGSALVRIVPGARDVTVANLTFVARPAASAPAGPGCQLDAAIWVEGRRATVLANRVLVKGETFSPCGLVTGIRIGDAVLSDPGTAGAAVPASALVSHNAVRDMLGQGISVAGLGSSATVQRNSIRYWHLDAELNQSRAVARAAGARPTQGPAGPLYGASGIAIVEGANATVYGNEISSGPNAVLLVIIISGQGAATPGLTHGILVSAPDGVVQVRGNTIRRAAWGIGLYDVEESLTRGNVLTDHFMGIVLDDASRNKVAANQVGPGLYGIVIEPQFGASAGGPSERNIVSGNTSLGHDELDCWDTTSGERSAGTANSWWRNTGFFDSPSGLCTDQD